jgi:hypothetical protein
VTAAGEAGAVQIKSFKSKGRAEKHGLFLVDAFLVDAY